MNNQFPYNTKEDAFQEFLHDNAFNKIKHLNLEEILNDAWKVGKTAAEDFLRKAEESNLDFQKVAENKGLQIIDHNVDKVVGNTRYFSEYITKRKIIHMYLKSIELWATSNNLSFNQAYNYVLCHEYFHFLEYEELGLTSKQVEVPIIKFGPIRLGKTGIKALSEIAAYSFVDTIFSKEEI